MALAPRFWRVIMLNLLGRILNRSLGHLDPSVALNRPYSLKINKFDRHCLTVNIFHKATAKRAPSFPAASKFCNISPGEKGSRSWGLRPEIYFTIKRKYPVKRNRKMENFIFLFFAFYIFYISSPGRDHLLAAI